jgi:stage II sporulation protein D
MIYTTVLLGFLILSYELILGKDKNVTGNIDDPKAVIQTINSGIAEEDSGVPFSLNIDTIKVYLTKKNKVVDIDLEEYIKGVVASEMPLNFNKEAYGPFGDHQSSIFL